MTSENSFEVVHTAHGSYMYRVIVKKGLKPTQLVRPRCKLAAKTFGTADKLMLNKKNGSA